MSTSSTQEQHRTEAAKPSQNKSTEETVRALREEIKSNKALKALCHIFAQRERARSQITMGSLRQTMYKEKLNFTVPEYEKALRFLSSLGIGKIQYNRSGKIQALKDIKITLQSIGLAAISEKDTLVSFSNQKKFVHLPTMGETKAVSKTASIDTTAQEESRSIKHSSKALDSLEPSYSAFLTVDIEGKPVTFQLPRKITPKELGEILSQVMAYN